MAFAIKRKGGASASPDRLRAIDWLAAFASPIIAATVHSIAGGL